MGSMLSGLFGGGSSSGQQQQMGAMKAARGDIQQYRPEAMQARINALRNMTGAYQGANNALETLWGDPNAKPPEPQRLMGHDMPQSSPQPGAMGQAIGGAAMPSFNRPPPRRPGFLQQGVSTLVDPLNIFKGR